MAGLILLLVFVAGYAVQRGSICAVAAVEDLVEARRPERFLAFFVCAALALAVMAAAALLGLEMLDHYRGAEALVPPLAGGALFGVGAWINGRCAFGTIARLGSGELARIGTVVGLLAGFLLAARAGLEPPWTELRSPLADLSLSLVLGGAVALALALSLALRRRPELRSPDGGWHPLAAMAIIGAANGALLVLAAGWPYTSLLMDLARAPGMDLVWRGTMAAVFVGGALTAAIVNGAFRSAWGAPSRWMRCLLGGLLMGIGATLVPGGNDTMLLVGLPLLLPNLALAYAAMMAVLLLIALAARFRTRPRPAAA